MYPRDYKEGDFRSEHPRCQHDVMMLDVGRGNVNLGCSICVNAAGIVVQDGGLKEGELNIRRPNGARTNPKTELFRPSLAEDNSQS